jgi:hypothetical protein
MGCNMQIKACQKPGSDPVLRPALVPGIEVEEVLFSLDDAATPHLELDAAHHVQ